MIQKPTKNKTLIFFILYFLIYPVYGQKGRNLIDCNEILMQSLNRLYGYEGSSLKYPFLIDRNVIRGGELKSKEKTLRDSLKAFLSIVESKRIDSVFQQIDKDTAKFVWNFQSGKFKAITDSEIDDIHNKNSELYEKYPKLVDTVNHLYDIDPQKKDLLTSYFLSSKPYFITKELFIIEILCGQKRNSLDGHIILIHYVKGKVLDFHFLTTEAT
jgi:hypothetical protein